MFISFSSGGKTLMKWREPDALMRRFFGKASLIGLLLFVIFYVTKSMRETGQPFKEFPVLLFFLLSVGALCLWLFVRPIVRLRETCVSRRLGKYTDWLHYNEIQAATVRKGFYSGEACSIIKFKLMDKPKSFFGRRRLDEITIPSNVNLEQAMQILRDKGVKVEQHNHT